MTEASDRDLYGDELGFSLAPRRVQVVRFLFSLIAAGLDALTIVAFAVATGVAWHLIGWGEIGPLQSYAEIGTVVAILFVVPNSFRAEYSVDRYLTLKGHLRRTIYLWNVAFLALLAVGFITKMTDIYSRVAIILFYASGFLALALQRLVLVRLVTLGSKAGVVSTRRVLLVGRFADVDAFARRYQPWNLGLHIVGTAVLWDDTGSARPAGAPPRLDDDLAAAVKSARVLRPDDVFVVVPWQERGLIDRCVEAFLAIPASIHLAPERILDRFDDVRIEKIGGMATLELSRPPLNFFEVTLKRLFDMVAAGIGLLLLAPLFLLVALLIKLDSKGPVFFRQDRFGFNQRAFRIWKFRSMTAADNGPVVMQAKRGDARVTRIGAWLRRTNIDELPQLINVLTGDMSLVGPRPHALAHDRDFETRIALYARRHNVKPGITGWAQVNGWRGETDTDEKMRARIEHDLWYIDNWSFALDLRILVLTFLSRRAFRNAY